MSIFKFLIMDSNMISRPGVDLTATSEDPYWLVGNITHPFRAKVWRSGSAGTFEITDDNKYLNFKETLGGPEITAILDKGVYTAATLAAEIKFQMDLRSLNSRIYTISRSTSTFKWTITGSTYLELLSFSGTNAADGIWTTIGFSPYADLTSATTYTGVQKALHSYEAVTIDLKTNEDVDSVAVLWDARQGMNLSSAAELRFQASATLNWDNPPVNVVMTADTDSAVATAHWANTTDLRYFRLKITDPQNSDDYVEVGSIFLSKATDFKCPDVGFLYKLKDYSKDKKNDYGNVFVDEYPLRRRLEFKFKNANYTYMTTLRDIFRRVGNKKQICVWLDPSEMLFQENNFFLYGRFITELDLEHVFYDVFSTGFEIEEVF